MNLEQALDFLASNCPTVFESISTELTELRKENETIKVDLEATQNALNDLIFSRMGDM